MIVELGFTAAIETKKLASIYRSMTRSPTFALLMPRIQVSVGISDHQSTLTPISKVCPGPIKDHSESVLKSDQEENVDDQPCAPGDKAG